MISLIAMAISAAVRPAAKHIDQLPTEVLEHILSFLELPDRKLAALVSRRWCSTAFSYRNMARVKVSLPSWDCIELSQGAMRPYRHLEMQYILNDAVGSHTRNTLDQILRTVESFTCIIKSMSMLCGVISKMSNLKRITLFISKECHNLDATEVRAFPILKKLSYFSIMFEKYMNTEQITVARKWFPMIQAYGPQLNELEIQNPYYMMPIETLDLRMLETIHLSHRETQNEMATRYNRFNDLLEMERTKFFEEASLLTLFAGVPQLKTALLDIDMTNSVLAVIEENCPMLTELRIRESGTFKTTLFSSQDGFQHLKILVIQGGLKPRMLEGCKPLKSIHTFFMFLYGTRESCLQCLEQVNRVFPNLQDLFLGGFELDDYLVRIIYMFPQLRRLRLDKLFPVMRSENLPSFPDELADMCCIEELTLVNVNFPNSARPINSLKRLNLAGGNFCSVSNLMQVWSMFPNLQYLGIPESIHKDFSVASKNGKGNPHCVIQSYVCETDLNKLRG